ncbi:class I SAM-dependent methyltransferase [Chamaesiphon sp. OTE_75_metabat_556]|uniref:class I SAM-dependent methyltransferase n=1 Tax=Chamaesiphon sp. OTE_75_metabat_556 TaxID=2964692 RepID=UPI00286B2CD3|nr:class I SAM-dependent methyltransferase [Chamaesiphon sp. OTE_75_metabat_556]
MKLTECPICNSRLLESIKLTGSRTGKEDPLEFCVRCTSFFQRPNYQEDDGNLIADLQWHVNKHDEHKSHSAQIIHQLLNYKPEIKTMLDIGCGIGTTLLVAKELGVNCVGVEPNPYATEYAKQHLSLDLISGYFSANVFSDKFDAIVIDMVLEHVPLIQSFMTDVFSILKPEGVVYLAVPGLNWSIMRNALRLMLKRIDIVSTFGDNDVHINHFSKRGMVRLLKRHNAKIIQDLYPGVCVVGRS